MKPAFLAYGEYHHDIRINTWQSRNGPTPVVGSTGLYHLAILYPSRASLAEAYRRLKAKAAPISVRPPTRMSGDCLIKIYSKTQNHPSN